MTKDDKTWDNLLASPQSQAWLENQAAQVETQILENASNPKTKIQSHMNASQRLTDAVQQVKSATEKKEMTQATN